MASVVDKLRIVLDEKNAIKDVLDAKGKNPTDKLTTYKGLISELDNEEQVSYVLKASNGDRKYAQLSSRTPVTLTATANDIRQNTSAITNDGYTEGDKYIPSYNTTKGFVAIRPNSNFKITTLKDEYDYSELFCLIAPWNTSIEDSVAVDKTVLYDAVYPAGSTNKLADVVKDAVNKAIDLGIINGSTQYVIHFMTYKEEY